MYLHVCMYVCVCVCAMYKHKYTLLLRNSLTKQLITNASFQDGRYFNGKNSSHTYTLK